MVISVASPWPSEKKMSEAHMHYFSLSNSSLWMAGWGLGKLVLLQSCQIPRGRRVVPPLNLVRLVR